jgi:hypothetical protein
VILVRSLAHRAGTTLALLLVALCSVAAAAAGPTYNAAARESILQDQLRTSDLVGHTLEASAYGSVTNVLPDLTNFMSSQIRGLTKSAAEENRLFAPPIASVETQSYVGAHTTSTTLAWFSAACHAVQLDAGRCPTAKGQAMLSRAFADEFHFKLGQQIKALPGLITVTGIYAPPDPDSPAWYDRGNEYFPEEIPCPQGHCSPNNYDVIFTVPSTFSGLSAANQAKAEVDRPLNANGVKAGDLHLLNQISIDFLGYVEEGNAFNISAQTAIGDTVTSIQTSWRKLSVPIVVVSAELIVLVWILMFILVVDANEARAAEVALAKLRGLSRLRMLRFALGEPTTLLLLSFPVGTALGWLAAKLLAAHQLRSGTPVHFVGLGWLFGGLATLGGLVPVVIGARGILRRSVIEQWRRTPQQGGQRGWVLDAVVGVAAVIGLAQLLIGGHVDSSSRSPVALLVPALLGIAVAITSSRLLPAACRALYARTRRGGRIGMFLAVRHIGRRPAAMRTMVVLTTAVTLSTFGIASWAVGHANRTRVAQLSVGAPTVLTVNPNLGVNVAAAVDQADPSGRHAAAVEHVTEGGPVTLAVQLRRFAKIAHWSSAGVANATSLLGKLNTSSPAPLVIKGSAVRVSYSATKVEPLGASLNLDVVPVNSTGSIPLEIQDFTSKADGVRRTVTADIPSDNATVVGFDLAAPAVSQQGGAPVTGQVSIYAMQVKTATGWQDVPRTLDPKRWEASGAQISSVQSASSGGALQWTVSADKGSTPTLLAFDRPDSLPAIAANAVSAGQKSFNTVGMDGTVLSVTPIKRLAGIPGAPTAGVVVDLVDATKASYGVTNAAVPQVWVSGNPAPIEAALAKLGVKTLSVTSSQQQADLYAREGPGLASAVFAADAIVAAVLAAFGAILSLVVAARRRRHEYAAMFTAGVPRSALYASMAIEQLVVAGVAVVIGAIAGVVATLLTEPAIPEFITNPGGIKLDYHPSVGTVAVTAGGTIVLLLAVVGIGVWVMLRSIDPERLRAAAP